MDSISLLVVQSISPIVIAVVGVLCNVLIVMVYSRRKFKNSSSTSFLKILAFSDIMSIMTLIPYGSTISDITFLNINQLTCKIFTFIAYFFPTNSSWILTLLNIERMISIKYSNITAHDKRRFQMISILIITLWDLIYYAIHMPYINLFAFSIDTFENASNSTTNESTVYCDIEDPVVQVAFAWADLINYTLLPFVFMNICSILIIHSIYLSRKKFFLQSKKKDLKKIKKDIQFSSLILFLNLAFFLFNAPICLYSFFSLSGDLLYWILNIIYYLQYISNIFIYIIFNKEFKEEIFIIFYLKKKPIKINTTNT